MRLNPKFLELLDRVVKLSEQPKFIASSSVFVRGVTAEDVSVVKRLSRRIGINGLNWFEIKRIAANSVTDRYILIAELPGRTAGYIYYGYTPLGMIIYQIAVDGRYEGRGIGRVLLEPVLSKINADSFIYAYIKPGSGGSFRLFEGFGFKPTGVIKGSSREYVLDKEDSSAITIPPVANTESGRRATSPVFQNPAVKSDTGSYYFLPGVKTFSSAARRGSSSIVLSRPCQDKPVLIIVDMYIDEEGIYGCEQAFEGVTNLLNLRELFGKIYHLGLYTVDSIYSKSGWGSRIEYVERYQSPKDFSIPGLKGSRFVLVGGGLGRCHFNAFKALLSQMKEQQRNIPGKIEIHIPMDALYHCAGGRILINNEKIDRYIQHMGGQKGYMIARDGKVVSNETETQTGFYLWSKSAQMVGYLQSSSSIAVRGRENGADLIIDRFTDAMDHLVDMLTEQITMKGLKTIILEKLESQDREMGRYFTLPVLMLFNGLGLTGKTTGLNPIVSMLIRHGYGVRSLEFDHYILEKSERIVYYGRISKNKFKPEQLPVLITAEILREDLSDTNYVFWFTAGITEAELKSAGINQEDVKDIFKLRKESEWENAKTTEVVIEKFNFKKFIEDAWRLYRGEIVTRRRFNSATRGILKIGLNEKGEMTIYCGEQTIDDFTGEVNVIIKEKTAGERPVMKYKLTQDKEEKDVKESNAIDLKKIMLYIQHTTEGLSVLTFDETDYILDFGNKRLGLDIPYFVNREELNKLNLIETLPEEAAAIEFSQDENGRPILIHKEEEAQEIRIRTIRLKCGQDGRDNILYINDIAYKISKEKWGRAAVIIDLEWRALTANRIDLFERIIPGSRIICMEGIGVTADKELNKKAMTFNFYCDDEIRLYYRAPKRAEGEARKENPLEFIARRVEMQFSEENLLRKYMEDIEYRGVSMALEEILWTLYRDGKMNESKTAAVLNEYGITDIEKIIANLDRISEDVIIQKLRGRDWYPNGYSFTNKRRIRGVTAFMRLRIKAYITLRKIDRKSVV